MLKKLIRKLKKHITEKGDVLSASDLLEMLSQTRNEEKQDDSRKKKEEQKIKNQNGW